MTECGTAPRLPQFSAGACDEEVTKVILDMSRCKGCFLCASVCPKGVLTPSKELSAKGFGLIHLNEDKECIGCGSCYKLCPDYCIEIAEQ